MALFFTRKVGGEVVEVSGRSAKTSFRIDDDDDDDGDAVFKGCGERSRVEGYLSEKRSHPAPILPLLVVVNQMIWVVTPPSSSHHQEFYIF